MSNPNPNPKQVSSAIASYANRTDLLSPSVCEGNQLVNGLSDSEFSLVLTAGVLVLGLFIGYWERLVLCRRRSSKVRRIVETSNPGPNPNRNPKPKPKPNPNRNPKPKPNRNPSTNPWP